jgi:hypothetical protein
MNETEHNENKVNLRRMMLCLVTSLALAAAEGPSQEMVHAQHSEPAPAKLVQKVREATQRFADVNMATSSGYQPAFGCVSGPDHGAMGVHYINGTLAGDGEVDATKPEALIYEPTRTGMKLVGVEFIVDSATWLKNHPAPPTLEGQAFHLVNAPNRYAIPAFFELHVWAWRKNPNGAFVDWNNRVSCEQQ